VAGGEGVQLGGFHLQAVGVQIETTRALERHVRLKDHLCEQTLGRAGDLDLPLEVGQLDVRRDVKPRGPERELVTVADGLVNNEADVESKQVTCVRQSTMIAPKLQ